MLASDFGNLRAFMFGVPSLLVAVILGLVCLYFRLRVLARICGIVCILTGVLFFWSFPDARTGDRWLTLGVGVFSAAMGVVLVFCKRPIQSQSSDDSGEL